MVVPIFGSSPFPHQALTCQIEEGQGSGGVYSLQSAQSAGKLCLLCSSPESIILAGTSTFGGVFANSEIIIPTSTSTFEGIFTSRLARSMTAFLVSTDTVIRSPENILGTDSSPNMSWMGTLYEKGKKITPHAEIGCPESYQELQTWRSSMRHSLKCNLSALVAGGRYFGLSRLSA